MNDNLQQCFLCGEDTTLTDLHDEELEIPDVADVAIVHPLQLSNGLLKQWEKKLYDLSIVPVFPQINRPVYHLAAEDKGKTIIRSFDRKAMEPGSIKSTLDHYGWRKGPGMDAGAIPYFHKEDHDGKIMAVVETEGIFATGYDTDIDPRIGRVYFIDIARENARWFDAPKSDKDVRLIPLGRVPEVFYSEVLMGISAIQARKV